MRNMLTRFLAPLLALALLAAPAIAGGSTINTGQPATASGLNSLVVRQLALAAASDINGILGMHTATSAGSCPASPVVGEDCLLIGSAPYTWTKWTGSTGGWAMIGTINPASGLFTPSMSAGSIAGTAPINVTVSGGVATASLVIDGNFAVAAGTLALAPIASGDLIANCTSGVAEPTLSTFTSCLDRNIGSTSGMFPLRGGSVWGSGTFGTGLALSGSALNLQPASAGAIGGVNSIAAVSHQFVNSISTAGLPALSQPAFTDISGAATLAQLPTIGANTVIGSIAGGVPAALSKTQITTLVNTFTTTLTGAVAASGTPVGNFLRDDNTWQAAAGSGTVTGPTPSTANAVPRWSNTGGIVLLNSGVTIDGSNNMNVPGAFGAGTGISTGANTVIGYAAASATRNDFMNFGANGSLGNAQASFWFLRRNFDNASMLAVDGSGNVSSAGLMSSAGGFASGQTAHTVPINEGVSVFNNVGPGTIGQALISGGASADPSFIGGTWLLLNTLSGGGGTTVSDTSSFTSNYREYEIVFTEIVPSANGAVPQMQVHSGGAFKATGYLNGGSASGVSAVGVLSSPATTFLQLSNNSSVDTTNNPKNTAPGMIGTITAFNPSASQITIFRGDIGYPAAAGTYVSDVHTTGFWNTSGVIDGFQFGFGGTTTFTGTVEVYGRL